MIASWQLREGLQIGFGPALAELDGAGRIFSDDLLQSAAPQGCEGATAPGAIEIFFAGERGVFTTQIAEFYPAGGNTGILFMVHDQVLFQRQAAVGEK